MPATREQYLGCLLGLAVGDAVGAPWEGIPADMIFEKGPAPEIVAAVGGETIYYTDDTQMMIGVADVLAEHDMIDEDALARTFAENYHPDRCYGPAARGLIEGIGHGGDWRSLAPALFDGAGSYGNGAAMRVAPIGVRFCDDLDRVSEEARKSAVVTHSHELGVDGARMIALATALAVREGPFDRERFFAELSSLADTEEFQWQLETAGQLQPTQGIHFGNTLEAHRSVTTAICCFAFSPDDYEKTISRAIAQGFDVDTLAAMAGAICGARVGVDGVPRRLRDALEDNHQGRKYIEQLALKLYERGEEA